jgi:hypothetical protein
VPQGRTVRAQIVDAGTTVDVDQYLGIHYTEYPMTGQRRFQPSELQSSRWEVRVVPHFARTPKWRESQRGRERERERGVLGSGLTPTWSHRALSRCVQCAEVRRTGRAGFGHHFNQDQTLPLADGSPRPPLIGRRAS